MLYETVPSGTHPFLCLRRVKAHLTPDPLFWDTIFVADITSAEGLSNFSTLIHSPSKITAARSLQGDQAQVFIDLIDRVSGRGKPSIHRVLIMRRSSLHYPTLIRSCSGGAHGCFTRSAKLAGCCPLRMSFNQSIPLSVSLGGVAASRT